MLPYFFKEAALRMLLNNPHPDVAERPDEYIINLPDNKVVNSDKILKAIVLKSSLAKDTSGV